MLQTPPSPRYNPTWPNYQGNNHTLTMNVLLILFWDTSTSSQVSNCAGVELDN